MDNLSKFVSELNLVLQKQTPRILSQVCRDPLSSHYGCFDRNFWHYKIRDFSSIILQQGGLFAAYLGDRATSDHEKVFLQKVAISSIHFWAKRAERYGAFEEYYPWERSYPALAFSTLAIAKLVKRFPSTYPIAAKGLAKAKKQLERRFEAEALNQQVAGIAALFQISEIENGRGSSERLNSLLDQTLSYQYECGAFPEYGGSDIGYLSVTMDCLWDIYDISPSDKLRQALHKCLHYVWEQVELFGSSPGMHNSRNTDYILPYSFVRFLQDGDKEEKAKASRIINQIFLEMNTPQHFVWAIDDRYWCHYIGHSFVRALNIVSQVTLSHEVETKASAYSAQAFTKLLDGRIVSEQEQRIVVSPAKGGIYSVISSGHSVSDFGYSVLRDGELYTNHIWSRDLWTVRISDRTLEISGYLIKAPKVELSPFKHFVIRFCSFFLGSQIIAFLKAKAIHFGRRSNIQFKRTFSLEGSSVYISSELSGLNSSDQVLCNPRSSKRHVASADSFHDEDLVGTKPVVRDNADSPVWKEIREFKLGTTNRSCESH